MKKLFVFILFLGLFFSCAVEAQDSETTAIFGNNIGHVSNRPTFSRGLTMYTDGTLRFRDATAYLYSPASGTIGVEGIFKFDSATADTNAFTATATADTVVVSGATVSSIFIVSGMYLGGVDQQDVLQWEAKTDTLIVRRLASGESAAKYSWLWVR